MFFNSEEEIVPAFHLLDLEAFVCFQQKYSKINAQEGFLCLTASPTILNEITFGT